MANAFQEMLEVFGLTKKILAVNADNASSNDTQIMKLDQLDNMFHKDNWSDASITCYSCLQKLF